MHLHRRTLLRGAGASLALPFLECMGTSAPTAANGPVKRFATIYFPYGVSLAKPDGENAKWNWFPHEEGADYEFNESLKPLAKHRDALTILGGLSHPNCRKLGGHDTGDTFLTGTELKGSSLRNSLSVDQLAAEQIGSHTRFPSLTLSSDGGVGEATRSNTLSFARDGQPVPALSRPSQIFARLFGKESGTAQTQRKNLGRTRSMLDRVLGSASDLNRRLGKADQEKLDEYLSSVREVEKRVERSQAWLDIPKPTLSDADRERLNLESDDEIPQDFVRTMYDLMVLAFQSDSTRIATYQIASNNGAKSLATKFPQLLDFGGSLHSLAHGAGKPGGAEKLGKWDQWQASQLAYFLERLQSIPDGENGSLLDNTMVLYGSSNSKTHNNTNYPLVLAGGSSIGLQHGAYRRYGSEVPMSNLLLTLMDRLGVDARGFSDSNGMLEELVS